jgi:hypothetical protein
MTGPSWARIIARPATICNTQMYIGIIKAASHDRTIDRD